MMAAARKLTGAVGADRVADAAQGVNQRGKETRIHFFSQARDEDLDGARVVFMVPLPDAFAKFSAGKDASGFTHQYF